MRNCAVSQLDAQHVALVLSRNKALQSLDLRWNAIGHKAAAMILTALSTNTSLWCSLRCVSMLDVPAHGFDLAANCD